MKLGELPAWMARRSYHPLAMIRCVGRGIARPTNGEIHCLQLYALLMYVWCVTAYHRWAQKWMFARKPSFAGIGQATLGVIAIFYIGNYSFTSKYLFASREIIYDILLAKLCWHFYCTYNLSVLICYRDSSSCQIPLKPGNHRLLSKENEPKFVLVVVLSEWK